MKRYFKTEEESTRAAFARDLERTPERAKLEEERLGMILYSSVLKKLSKEAPPTRKFFVRDEELKTLLRKVVSVIHADVRSLAEGDLKLTLESFENLRLCIENSNVVLVGTPEKWGIFAVVDEADYHIGLYIPKTKRQIMIENAINKAIANLESYFAGKGALLGHYVRTALQDFLWQQSYPYQIPQIEINAVKGNLFGNSIQAVVMPNGRVLQMYYNHSNATLYYHVIF